MPTLKKLQIKARYVDKQCIYSQCEVDRNNNSGVACSASVCLDVWCGNEGEFSLGT